MLSIVGTPIGNIEDVSYRQAKTLLESDIILAEDTRTAQTFLHSLIRLQLFPSLPQKVPKVISYYKEKEMNALPHVMSLLDEEKNVSLISEAGMPIISDPGYLLVRAVIERGIPYQVIPGPSAVTTALLHTGMQWDSFQFVGFIPKKEGQLVGFFEKLSRMAPISPNLVFVCFDSPLRINKTLEVLDRLYPDAQVVLTRELTKEFETIYRGTPQDLAKGEYRGEITLVVKFS